MRRTILIFMDQELFQLVKLIRYFVYFAFQRFYFFIEFCEVFLNVLIFNEQIGLILSPLEKEKSVGPFFVDIMAEDQDGRPVIERKPLLDADGCLILKRI